MASPRDPKRTRRQILDAARREFADLGPAGARVDRIAAQAGVNKRMIYHYFANKDGLFGAVLADALRGVVLTEGDLVERLLILASARDTLRLWAWQALDDGVDGFDGDAWRSLVKSLWSESGVEPDSHDAMALLAVAIVPAILGPLSERVTGLDPLGEPFRRGQARMLERLVDAFADRKPRLRYRW